MIIDKHRKFIQASRVVVVWRLDFHGGETVHQIGNIASVTPCLDVWEDAYLLDYKPAERSRYIEAFFSNIDWSAVERGLKTGKAMNAKSEAGTAVGEEETPSINATITTVRRVLHESAWPEYLG